MKKTIVVGASENTSRYSNMVTRLLHQKGYEFVPLGVKKGTILGVDILDINSHPSISGVGTISMYIGTQSQKQYYDYFLNLNPHRIIFNPGAENLELMELVRNNGIEAIEACTLVMLNTNQY